MSAELVDSIKIVRANLRKRKEKGRVGTGSLSDFAALRQESENC